MINDWRASFSEPLNAVEESIANILDKHAVKSVYASRIKRMNSIVDKLRANEQMGLGTLQDIGGVRFVFETLEDTYKAYSIIDQIKIDGVEKVKEYDYIKGNLAPKNLDTEAYILFTNPYRKMRRKTVIG